MTRYFKRDSKGVKGQSQKQSYTNMHWITVYVLLKILLNTWFDKGKHENSLNSKKKNTSNLKLTSANFHLDTVFTTYACFVLWNNVLQPKIWL